jgi:hypothetical protein
VSTLIALREIGHFLYFTCWKHDFDYEWNHQGENPFIRLPSHRIQILPRATGDWVEICSCGYDYAEPSKRALDPIHLAGEELRKSDPFVYEIRQVVGSAFDKIKYQLVDKSEEVEWSLSQLADGSKFGEYSADQITALIRDKAEHDLRYFLVLFSQVDEAEGGYPVTSFTSMDEIDSFSEAQQHWECLVSRACLRAAENEAFDPMTRSVLSDIGHILLFEIDSLASSVYGYGVVLVDPDQHRPQDGDSACTCGFPTTLLD